MTTALVLFHSNLRLGDNMALARAATEADAVVPVFILDETTGRAPGAAARWWLHRSLERLAAALDKTGSPLILRRGDTLAEVAALVSETGAEAVYLQHGYDPGVQKMEEQLHAWGQKNDVAVKRFGGQVLFRPEDISTQEDKPYTVFSPFWRTCLKEPAQGALVRAPGKLARPDSLPASLALDDLALLPEGYDWTGGLSDSFTPGEEAAYDALDRFIEEGLETYKDDRDRPDLACSTSRLSPHLRFGEISPRTIWHRVHTAMAERPALERGGEHFLRELGWRDFSYHLLHHFPDLPTRALKPAFDDFPWRSGDPDAVAAWQQGQTGFPIVDAGMRQLWQTGWMHNRVRMIVASFLVKELLLHWREGEAWFWDTLVDADPASNTASWQWVAGSGADAAPYFRIFNPVLQGEKFDPAGDYVRRFVPEIAGLPDTYIHKPWEAPRALLDEAGITLGSTYPEPLVDRKEARKRALAAFETIKKDR